jgi:hypothetical protein
MASLLVLPNLLMTTALASHELAGGEARTKYDLEKTLNNLMNLDKHLN